MNSGYWQVVVEEEAQEILALFTTDVNRWFEVMHMRSLYAAPKIAGMTMRLKME